MRFKQEQIFAAVLALLGLVLSSAAIRANADPAGDDDRGGSYAVHSLVSDGGVPADHVDANLVNPWGVVFNPTGPVWIADNGTGRSTLYDGTGNALGLVVTIPAVNGDAAGNPTGIVFSGGADFVVTRGALKGPARFIFAGENGTISAWAPAVDGTNAIVTIDHSAQHAVYKGIAYGGNGVTHVLYATDFHNARVDMFDGTFQPIATPGAFVDPRLPTGYAPFGIQNISGDIYVTYALQDAAAHDNVAGNGLGFVDVFDSKGTLLRRVASRGALNAPWGVALAPASFGRFGGALLLGNFGDGVINAYDPRRGGEHLGALRTADGHRIKIDGLWGIAFGNGVQSQPTNTLFFTAGPAEESHGQYGAITAH